MSATIITFPTPASIMPPEVPFTLPGARYEGAGLRDTPIRDTATGGLLSEPQGFELLRELKLAARAAVDLEDNCQVIALLAKISELRRAGGELFARP